MGKMKRPRVLKWLLALPLLTLALAPNYPPLVVGDVAWQQRWSEALTLMAPDERWEASFIKEIREGGPTGEDKVCAARRDYVVYCGPDSLLGTPERALFDASMLLHEATHLRNLPGRFNNECLAYTRQVEFLAGRVNTVRGIHLTALVIQRQTEECH